MRKALTTSTCVLISCLEIWAQVDVRSMVVHSRDGRVSTYNIERIDSISFSTSASVQQCQWFYTLENPGIADYLREFDYNADDYTYHHIFDYRGEPYLDARQDWPYGVTLGDTTYYNLIPGRLYELERINNGERKPVTIQTLGQLRMIRAEGIDNVRDMGGWPTTDGHRIRYGCLYRGTELNTLQSGNSAMKSAHHVTENDVTLLRHQLGITAELDLRSNTEIPTTGKSVLGDDIVYYNAPISYTDVASTYNKWLFVQCLIFINQQLSVGNGAVYVHCIWGADRTGLLCMLLEGLLGVKQSDLDKDYEITSFSGNTRYRTNINYRNAINNVLSKPGDTLQEKFRNWWKVAGATDMDIDTFCQIMIE